MEDRAGPSVNSSDPEERKLARSLRIKRRENAIANLEQNDEEEEVVIVKTPIELQVEKSNRILDNLLVEGNAYVRNIRRAADIRLIERNKFNDKTKQRILTEFEAQAEEAAEKFQEIITKWTGLTNLNDPLQIHEAILHQKSQCIGLLNKKDEFIQKLKLELIEIDKNFEKDIAKQKDDMEVLTHRINLQTKYLRGAFETQFHTIQNVIHSEKQKFFKMRNDLWNELYGKYMKKEYENSEYLIEQRNEMRQLLNGTRDHFSEELRQTNLKLDNDLHVTRDELERIKAIVKNNLEKWEYNFWILESRRNENIFIKAEQKTKITYLQGKIIGLQKNLRDFNIETAKKIRHYELSLKKVKENILQIEDKADRFASSNEIMFNQIWDLNRQVVLDQLDKIYMIDKALHQQQLGLPWNEPNIKNVDKQLMPSYQHAVNLLQNQNIKLLEKSKNVQMRTNGSLVSQKWETDVSIAESAKSFNPSYRRLVKHLMVLISDKSGFLTEGRLKLLLRGCEEKDRNLVKLWNVFNSLGINGIEEIDALFAYFLPYCYCPVCAEIGVSPLEQDNRGSSFSQSIAGKSEMTQGLSMFLTHLEYAFEGIQQPISVIEEVLFELVDSSISIPKDESSVTDKVSEDMLNIVHAEMEKEKKQRTKKRLLSGDERFQCIYNHPLVISSVYILVALKDFVTSYLEHTKEFPTNQERLRRHRYTVSRLLDNKDIKMIWSMLKDGFSQEQSRIWNGLEEGVKKYYDILVHRKAVSEDVLKLRRENHKLKKLLNIYMANSTNMPRTCGIKSIV